MNIDQYNIEMFERLMTNNANRVDTLLEVLMRVCEDNIMTCREDGATELAEHYTRTAEIIDAAAEAVRKSHDLMPVGN